MRLPALKTLASAAATCAALTFAVAGFANDPLPTFAGGDTAAQAVAKASTDHVPPGADGIPLNITTLADIDCYTDLQGVATIMGTTYH